MNTDINNIGHSIKYDDKYINDIIEENNLILEQLQIIRNKIINNNNIINNINNNATIKNLYKLSDEYLKLYYLVKIQSITIQVKQKNSIESRLGNILIQGTTSWRSFIAIPFTLFRFWKRIKQHTPPIMLGDKNFNKLFDIYKEKGINYVNELLNSLDISFEMKANAYTELARTLIQINEQDAAFFAFLAWEIDPEPFRLKWLAFRIHESNDPIMAEALINMLPEKIKINNKEERHIDKIINESKIQRYKIIQNTIDKYLTNKYIQSNYIYYLNKEIDRISVTNKNIVDKINQYNNKTIIYKIHAEKQVNNCPCAELHIPINETSVGIHSSGMCGQLFHKKYNLNNEQIHKSIDTTIKTYYNEKLTHISNNKILTCKKTLYPKISIIIPVYNNYNYIKTCLNSVVNQTLKDIEIIIVDDCSDDGSDKIIEYFSEQDKRIIFIKYNIRKSQSQARKDGVLLSSAPYIMFLDSDDFLESNACEIAYSEIKKLGCDIIQFETIIHNTGNVSLSRVNNLEKFLNNYESKLYLHDEIFDKCFNKQNFNFTIWNKIYKSDLCKKAFSLIEDGYYPKAQDLYAFFVISSLTKNLYKINKKLYNYNFGIGVTEIKNSKKDLDILFSQGKILAPLYRYVKAKKALNIDLSSQYINLKNRLLNDSMTKLFTINKNFIYDYFKINIKNYGLFDVLFWLIDKYFYNQDFVAKNMQGYEYFTLNKEIKNVGIFYFRISPGGVQRVIQKLCYILTEKTKFNVVLFLEEQSDYDLELPHNIKKVYIDPSSDYRKEKIKKHIISLSNAIEQNNIDIMCYQAGSSASLLWDMLLIHEKNIPILVTFHECFSYFMSDIKTQYGIKKHEVFKLAERLICLSEYAEFYFSSLGIKALYNFNPVTIPDKIKYYERKHKIIIIGRLDDKVKQIYESLNIIHMVKEKINDITAFFVGDFNSYSNKNNFLKKVDDLGLKDNIVLTGWTNEVEKYIDQSALLLCTSYSESFSLAIFEAQSRGLPCVIYKLPIQIAIDNESIIQVDQLDKISACNNIIKLLSNKDLCRKLSKIAVEHSKKFSEELFLSNFIKILNNINCNYKKKNFSDHIINEVLYSMLHHYQIAVRSQIN